MKSSMGTNFLSGLVAGNTAAMFWIAFSLMFGAEGEGLKTVGLVAVIFLVVGTIASTFIAQMVSAKKSG